MGVTQSVITEERGDNDKPEIKRKKKIEFYLQGELHTVSNENLSPTTSLNSYIRKTLNLTGTKDMCLEGGCGCCVVVIEKKDPRSGKNITLSVNSCLMPLLSCNDYKIYTSEGIGNPHSGYHPIQKVLAKFNGTQCGFCSPGMVMNMYALHQSGQMTMKDVEDAFGGNICRCTGYRPILSAFKSLSTDASPDLLGHIPDIEDLRICRKDEFVQIDAEDYTQRVNEPGYHLFDDSKWVKVFTFEDLLSVMNVHKDSRYKLVAGNTAQGVYKSYKNTVDVYIDITSVPELSEHNIYSDNCVLGGNITLTETIRVLSDTENISQFDYFKQMAEHLQLVANVPVRNRGTLAGNLMIKHDHKEFPSDVFLLLETVKARLTIVNAINGERAQLSLQDFLTYDMRSQVLLNITLPRYSSLFKFVSYKIMPRAQNVHAIVNAGFLFKFNENQNLDAATIVYGNINNSFVHADATEKLLVDKNLFDNGTLQAAYKSLTKEITTDSRPPDPSPECRKRLAIALFYKAVLNLAPVDKISIKNRSGGILLERPISKGAQNYETKTSLYPLTQAIAKVEALAQTSGQAQYIDDMPDLPYQLYGVLVLAKALPNSIIQNIDTEKALKVGGVVAFFKASDIPGNNNFTPPSPLFSTSEEIFCSGRVLYYDQPIGVLVGKNEDVVKEASKLIEVTYSPPNSRPMLSIRQILTDNKAERIKEYKIVLPKRKGADVKHVIKGNFDIYQQYHFHMETLCCNVVPTEDGLDVYPATQYMEIIQIAIAKMLNITDNKITVNVRRCGGAFGAKASRTGLVACAAALAAWKLKQPVRIKLPLTTNMAAIGKRAPFSADYEAGVNDKGTIQYLDATLYTDLGAVSNDTVVPQLIMNGFTSTYNFETFKLQLNTVITDTPINTWMRAPGTTESLAAMETIMEHIGYAINVDPLQVRVANLGEDSSLLKYIEDLKSWAGIDKRKQDISSFNKVNRWKKMGLSVVVMQYGIHLHGLFSAMVSIFQNDGTVQVSHGGIEMGQGINTKAAQVCAYKLGIALEHIVVKPSNNFVAPNNACSGGSVTSEAICYGIVQACEILLKRIEPYRNQLPINASWKDIITKCYENFVDLTAMGTCAPGRGPSDYPVYGICASEVLVDILTGQYFVTRTDLIEDVGQSMSPVIDIGQVEGAFVMGMGYHTSEKIKYDIQGKILTKNTWTYHVPGAKDIPVDFRVKFPSNNPNPQGVLNSKATGEPALCLSISVPLAIRNALASARTDTSASNSKWYPIDGPTDVEDVIINCGNQFEQFVL